MTKGEFIALFEHCDDDTEMFAASVYDYDTTGKKMSISDADEIDFYHEDDGDKPAIVLIFNDEENR